MPSFQVFKKDFYLAGGTALALFLGHRISVDFDFFNPKDFDPETVFQRLKKVTPGHGIRKIQEEKNTLTVIIDGEVKISFFGYAYPLLKKTLDEKQFRLASMEDIACMKLSAILGRSSYKDFVDIYYILHHIDLWKLLLLAEKKFQDTDVSIFMKSLVYFDEVEEEPIQFLGGHHVDYETIKKYLRAAIRKIPGAGNLK